MRPLSVLSIAVLLLAPTSVRAETLTTAEVLEKYEKIVGGAKRWSKLTSMEWTGMETTFSVPSPFTLVRKRPNLYRFERTVLKRPVEIVFDGETAWWKNPLMGAEWPVEIPSPDSDITRREADFDGPLMNAEARGHRVRLQGLDRLDGAPAYLLKVTLKDGAEESWYLDPKSFLPLARFSQTTDFGQPMEKATYFSEYREVDGILLAHRLEMEFGTRHEVLALEKVRFNFDIDDASFRMPPPEGMDVLAPLAGTWEVLFETRPDPRLPWSETRTTSTITSLLGGRLLEERLDSTGQGEGFDVVGTWSYDRFQEIYRLTRIDTFTGHQTILEGKLEERRLIASNQESGTTWSAGGQTFHARVALHHIEPDSFRVDTEVSTDGGKTWFNDSRFTYTRKTGD